MKKLISLLISVLLIVTVFPFGGLITVTAEVPTELSISYAETSPIIDGVVDSSYGDMQWNQSATDIPIGEYNLFPRTPEECEPFKSVFNIMNMKGWLSYDADGIYMAVEATDLYAFAPVDSSEPWKSTHIKVVLYTNSSCNFFTLSYDGKNKVNLYNDSSRSCLDISKVTDYALSENISDNTTKLVWEIKIPYEALWNISSINEISDMRLGVIQTSMAYGYCCQAFGKAYSLVYSDLLPVTINPIPDTITTGKTGDCTWTLDGTVLTISGEGEMADYEYKSTNNPWNDKNGMIITKIVITKGVTRIGEGAFSECSNVISVTIPNTVKSIGDYAFNNCSSLTSIDIPDGVTSIGEWAFYGCSSLTSIDIPDGVTSIGGYAFYDCNSLTSINIPDSVTSIGRSTFYNCSSLTSIDIPDGVTSIGEWAFYDCSSLTIIDIPDSVTSIGGYAFSDCSSLTSINIPDGVTSIGYSAFGGCYYLENVYITDIEAWCKIEFESDDSNPMYYAENLYVNNQLLTDVKIPDNTEIINSYNFYNCKSIESVFIPKSMILIKQDAFYNCRGIKNVYYEGTAEEWAEVTVLSGNDYLKNATVYYNNTGIPGGVT